MNTRSATQRKTLWVALAFLLAAASAQGQSAWVYADVYYDAATDNVVATTTTLVDYSTEYYYSPKVQVSLSGSDGSYAWWYCPVAGAGACTNGPYAFGDVTLSATPGVTYTVQGYHSVETYYYYYDVDPGCMWGCSQWYDALGYSTGVCSPACQADPFCYCIATTGGASARTYFPPHAPLPRLRRQSGPRRHQQAVLHTTGNPVLHPIRRHPRQQCELHRHRTRLHQGHQLELFRRRRERLRPLRRLLLGRNHGPDRRHLRQSRGHYAPPAEHHGQSALLGKLTSRP